jgi:hypothetical protein
VHALECSEQTSDFTEYRYKDQLKGAIRLALCRTLLLAENMDYGRSKPFFDAKAPLLLQWLCAEEALIFAMMGATPGPPPPQAQHTPQPQAPQSLAQQQAQASLAEPNGGSSGGGIDGRAAAALRSASLGPPPSPTRPAHLSLDDVPVRTTPLPVFGSLQPHAQASARGLAHMRMRTCEQALARALISRERSRTNARALTLVPSSPFPFPPPRSSRRATCARRSGASPRSLARASRPCRRSCFDAFRRKRRRRFRCAQAETRACTPPFHRALAE